MPAAIKMEFGDRYNSLVYVNHAEPRLDPANKKCRMAVWRCDCGNVKTIQFLWVRNGNTKSCSCKMHDHATKHGEASTAKGITPEYVAHRSLLTRCSSNPKCKDYDDYYGRGIRVCAEWLDKDTGYIAFLSDMGRRPSKGHTVERANTDKGYNSDNCYWGTWDEQAANRRSSCYWIVDGVTYPSLKSAAAKHKVAKATIENWCKGYVTKKGTERPPKANCSYRKKY